MQNLMQILFYSLSDFECYGHTVHMLTQWCLPPPLTSTVKSSLFMHHIPVPSPWLPGHIDVQTILVTLTMVRLFWSDLIYPLPPHAHSPSHHQHPPPEQHIGYDCDPLLTHRKPSESTAYFRAHSWGCTFKGFGQSVMTGVPHPLSCGDGGWSACLSIFAGQMESNCKHKVPCTHKAKVN